MPPKISIIVPVYNGEKTLPLCLDSLLNLDYPKKNLEIIIVDNASTDGTADIINRYPVRYVFESRKGRAQARNKGIKSAKGELIAFLDADCIAHKNWIKNISKGCDDPSVGGCGGELYTYDPTTLWEKYADNRGFFHQECFVGKETLIPALRTSNVIYPKDVLESIGLFDETFYSGEDLELSLRIVLKGLKLAYAPDAIVLHKHRNGLTGFFSQFFIYGRYDKAIYKKYKNFIALDYDRMFKHIFLRRINFKNLSGKGKFLESLFMALDFFVFLAYFSGWLSLSPFEHLYTKSFSAPNFILNKVFRKLGNELIISDISKQYNYALGEVGTRIYELLISGIKNDEVIDKISEEYLVSKDVIKNDLVQFITELEKEKLFS